MRLRGFIDSLHDNEKWESDHMAEYRKLALDLIVADGTADEAEIKLLKKHLYADGKIDQEEVVFILDLRAALGRKDKEATNPVFDKFVLKVITDYLFTEGKSISDDDVALTKKITNDKKIDIAEVKKFFTKIKKDLASHAGLVKLADDYVKKNP